MIYQIAEWEIEDDFNSSLSVYSGSHAVDTILRNINKENIKANLRYTYCK